MFLLLVVSDSDVRDQADERTDDFPELVQTVIIS